MNKSTTSLLEKSTSSPLQEWLQHKFINPEDLEDWVATLRRQGKTIATLNGSFDLMHAGHLHILYEGSLTADVLLVALNTDSSIARYKSPLRPIIPLKYRLQLMAAIEFVDYVTWFDETDPCAFLERVRPDVHVNGIEYGPNCIETSTVEKNGGRIHLVDRIDGLATSDVISRVITQCGS